MPSRRYSWEKRHGLVPDGASVEIVSIGGIGIGWDTDPPRRKQAPIEKIPERTTVPRRFVKNPF